jgi:hypothetical protein
MFDEPTLLEFIEYLRQQRRMANQEAGKSHRRRHYAASREYEGMALMAGRALEFLEQRHQLLHGTNLPITGRIIDDKEPPAEAGRPTEDAINRLAATLDRLLPNNLVIVGVGTGGDSPAEVR